MRLPTPQQLILDLPLRGRLQEQIHFHRENIRDIIHGRSKKIAIIAGPCSLHNPASAIEYARRLKALSDQVDKTFFIVMRAYLEKPRTKMGWKGYLYDPYLDGSCDIAKGLYLSRELLLELADIGLPLATEFLDPLTAPYYEDLISWGFIVARTTSSSIHRQLASCLEMPVGLKNSTEGSVETAIHGIKCARQPHTFISSDKEGHLFIKQTDGNSDTHLVLRGSDTGPNYDNESVRQVAAQLKEAGIHSKILVDCSHGNSGKIHEKQLSVFNRVISQLVSDDFNIMGVMLESFLEEGNQSISENVSSIKSSLLFL
jgi:3-deoxy-7-phosphoheptulonate synthase